VFYKIIVDTVSFILWVLNRFLFFYRFYKYLLDFVAFSVILGF